MNNNTNANASPPPTPIAALRRVSRAVLAEVRMRRGHQQQQFARVPPPFPSDIGGEHLGEGTGMAEAVGIGTGEGDGEGEGEAEDVDDNVGSILTLDDDVAAAALTEQEAV